MGFKVNCPGPLKRSFSDVKINSISWIYLDFCLWAPIEWYLPASWCWWGSVTSCGQWVVSRCDVCHFQSWLLIAGARLSRALFSLCQKCSRWWSLYQPGFLALMDKMACRFTAFPLWGEFWPITRFGIHEVTWVPPQGLEGQFIAALCGLAARDPAEHPLCKCTSSWSDCPKFRKRPLLSVWLSWLLLSVFILALF